MRADTGTEPGCRASAGGSGAFGDGGITEPAAPPPDELHHNPLRAIARYDVLVNAMKQKTIIASPRNVAVAGARVTIAVFLVGMGALLYAIFNDATGWMVFWWAFVTVFAPACSAFFYHETRLFYEIQQRGTDEGIPEQRHRIVAAVAAMIALAAAMIYIYSSWLAAP
jgi:hypothetical protein